jgi:hypothetical protein
VVIESTCDLAESGGGVVKATCVIDPLTGDQGFHTGGSKDVNDISQWGWSAASGEQSPPKNNIKTAFGALTLTGGGQQVLYFGLTREPDTNQGNNNVGFWFLQNPVVLAAGGTWQLASGGPAAHTIGDIFLVAEFTNGGTVSNLKVYQWVGPNNGREDTTTQPALGGGNSALQLRSSTAPNTSTGCNDGTLPADAVCVGVNNVAITPAWVGSSVQSAIFFEGGVNLSAMGFA